MVSLPLDFSVSLTYTHTPLRSPEDCNTPLIAHEAQIPASPAQSNFGAEVCLPAPCCGETALKQDESS